MRGGGGVRRLSLLAGGLQTYPRALTIKLPYVTKNFITFTFYFNIFNIISFNLTTKHPFFKNFIITNFIILNLYYSKSFIYSFFPKLKLVIYKTFNLTNKISFISNFSRTSNFSSSLIFNKPLNIKKKTSYNLL